MTTPDWLKELDAVQGVCNRAKTTIRTSDPNVAWHSTGRGDWMLYYMWAVLYNNRSGDSGSLISISGSAAATERTNEIADHVKCPVDEYGTYDWSTTYGVGTGEELGQLAERIRLIWPDIPLVL